MWCVVKDAEQRVYAQHGGGPGAAQGSYEPSDIARIRYEHIVSAKLDERQQTRSQREDMKQRQRRDNGLRRRTKRLTQPCADLSNVGAQVTVCEHCTLRGACRASSELQQRHIVEGGRGAISRFGVLARQGGTECPVPTLCWANRVSNNAPHKVDGGTLSQRKQIAHRDGYDCFRLILIKNIVEFPGEILEYHDR
ncbi:conserved hypothetical protein [Ricinus communis]|uniref:Uncharacterized protein n=1 Tax=Ricinus communis TaxID=3988 RepID=B9T9T5_RICCO|nr:conserved hypothetical protein [Ricinus communis]